MSFTSDQLREKFWATRREKGTEQRKRAGRRDTGRGRKRHKEESHTCERVSVTEDLGQLREDARGASGSFGGAASHGPVILAVAAQGFCRKPENHWAFFLPSAAEGGPPSSAGLAETVLHAVPNSVTRPFVKSLPFRLQNGRDSVLFTNLTTHCLVDVEAR